VLEALSQDADREFLMLDSTAVSMPAHGCRARGGQLAQAVARSRSSLSTKIHMAANALGYPLGFILTGANVSDFDQAIPLIGKHLKPDALPPYRHPLRKITPHLRRYANARVHHHRAQILTAILQTDPNLEPQKSAVVPPFFRTPSYSGREASHCAQRRLTTSAMRRIDVALLSLALSNSLLGR